MIEKLKNLTSKKSVPWYAFILSVLLCAGCTQPDKAWEVLHNNGYENIQITGYNFIACSKDDFYHTGFTAKSPSGQVVSGTVCNGLIFKGATIRFD